MSIPFDEARSIIMSQATTAGSFGVREVRLEHAVGCVCAADVFSGEALPRYTNSAVDGFSVNAAHAHAHAHTHVELLVEHRIIAGDAPRTARPDMACEIMTGAPIPESHDTVVKIEDTICIRDDQGIVTAVRLPSVSAGMHRRIAGSDFQRGTLVLSAGTKIRPAHILALAAVGVSRITVTRAPRVVIIATGGELALAGNKLTPGAIHNATSPYLYAVLPTLGAEVLSVSVVQDNAETFRQALGTAMAMSPDIVITTGAVSMGVHDFVPAVVNQLRGRILFHRIKMRPGGPMLFGYLPEDIPVFGLPGNPLSTVVGMRFFVGPYLQRRFGIQDEVPTVAQLTCDTEKTGGLTYFLKGVTSQTPEGMTVATVLQGQASYQIRPLLESNAWVMLPESGSVIAAGTRVNTFSIEP